MFVPDKTDAEMEIERRWQVRQERLAALEEAGGTAGADYWTHAKWVEIELPD
jgi:hypothetical protein